MTLLRRRNSSALIPVAAAVVLAAGLSSGSASAASAPAPLVGSGQGAVGGEYLVVLKDGAAVPARTPAGKYVAAAAERGRKAGADVRERFSTVLNGYSAKLDADGLRAVRSDPSVAYVQVNRTYSVNGTTQTPVTWGLDRIDQRTATQDDAYYYTNTGKGVTAYVVDTGIMASHPDFGGRVATGTNTRDGGSSTDCDGHGTHVAGTIGGGMFGVAKAVSLVPVKVLDCRGTGTSDSVVAGLDWVVQNHQAGQPAVLNLSAGGDQPGTDRAVEDALRKVVADGVTVVVAAGNKADNACDYTPAEVGQAITVGATNSKDQRASFSNYGRCVDIYAPGTNISSDAFRGSGASLEYGYIAESGTSMATPHVSGAVALYLQNHPTAAPATVNAAIYKAATQKKVTKVSASSHGRLLFAVQPQKAPTKLTTSPTKIQSGTTLVKGKKVCSPNGKYCLTQRSGDGKLVLYRASSKRTIWSSGKAGSWTTMSTTGNLIEYNGYGKAVWTSRTSGTGAAELRVRDRGYLALVKLTTGTTAWYTKPAE